MSFVLTKGQLELDADLTWGIGQDTILTVKLANTTVGDILSFLVNLVDPYLDFKLDPPWDILNSFSLDKLELVVNITKKTLGVTYSGTIDLVFMQITALTLTYETVKGESTVNINPDGTFLGEKLDKPMKWDALNGAPPQVPGKGNKVFDLQYLGLGQHVSLPSVANLDTMAKVITALEQTVIPLEDSTANPLDQLPGLVFTVSSGWLIGAKFTLIDTLELSVVFNDPLVYGLLIKLYGEKAKIFAGLEFEILYRRITDSIGVYHVELKLPDEMRHLEFGEVSITLPVLGLDIYTNGDFRIDVGFPTNGDFTRSFGLEIFPFVGAGGFYFAKLSAATATNIHQITNGVFNPVIEFGRGLSIGVGKEINEGILSAGISITIQGIFEGVIAWFHPTDTNTPTDHYYYLEASLSIVGHLYGSIDFAII